MRLLYDDIWSLSTCVGLQTFALHLQRCMRRQSKYDGEYFEMEHVHLGEMMEREDSRNCFADDYSHRQLFVGESYIIGIARAEKKVGGVIYCGKL